MISVLLQKGEGAIAIDMIGGSNNCKLIWARVVFSWKMMVKWAILPLNEMENVNTIGFLKLGK